MKIFVYRRHDGYCFVPEIVKAPENLVADSSVGGAYLVTTCDEMLSAGLVEALDLIVERAALDLPTEAGDRVLRRIDVFRSEVACGPN